MDYQLLPLKGGNSSWVNCKSIAFLFKKYLSLQSFSFQQIQKKGSHKLLADISKFWRSLTAGRSPSRTSPTILAGTPTTIA